MGIVLGFLCLICSLLLLTKIVTRICNLKRADSFLMRIHKPVSVILLICVFMHIAFVFPVLKNRNIFVSILGITTMFFMILLICFCHVIKDKKKKMFLHRVLAVVMALCIVGHIIAYYVDFIAYQHKVQNIVFKNIDLTKVEDGTYEGEYDVGYIYAKVKVEIKDGMIVSIELLEHRNEKGKPAERILDDVLVNQKIDVDVVGGATNSSKVIKKAIENAVNSCDNE